MSQIDFLARNFAKPVDMHVPRDAAAIGEEGTTSSDAESFGSLLQGLARRSSGSGADAQPEDDLHDIEAAGPAAGASGEDATSSVLALLHGVLSNPGALNATASSAQYRQQDGDPVRLPLDVMGQMQDEGGHLTGPSVPPKMMIAVQHQETHFKPVVEGLQAENTGAIEAASPEEITPPKLVSVGGSDSYWPSREARPSDRSTPSQVSLPPGRIDAPGDDTRNRIEKQGAIRLSEGSELNKAFPAKDTIDAGAATLPSETIHRLASAARSDLQGTTENGPPQPGEGHGAIQTISIKASDSALRILNLQLHPADLGMVTIKMRLAGDSLQMELHVEHEETAQILRRDSEKLSALLRGSGYRPDVISIHVGDGAVQDRVIARALSDMQMPNHSFSQGGGSQGGHSREQEKHYADVATEHHGKPDDHEIRMSHSPGGVYL